MRKFLARALEKIDKMDRERIRALIYAITEENDRLEMVLESMTDGVVVTGREHQILLFNKSAERLLPFAAGELMEKTIWDTVEDREIAGFLKVKLSTQEKIRDWEFTLDERGGRTLSVSIMPLVHDKIIRGNVIHIEDVTQKRTEQARLRRAESLAALTTLTAGVAHEIKNPLASIGIHLQLIKKAIEGRNTVKCDDVGEYLQVIDEEVGRLNQIVVDFLFAVRPMDAHLECRELNPVIRDLLDFLRFELDEAGVNVELQLSEELPRIRLDEKYLKQALLNIIKNAMTAMPSGGQLRIKTAAGDGELILTISDTGVGIPEEIIDKIFEPYFTTRAFGSGLGLTLVYKIVKEHLGEITVSSREGEGTSFQISFPVPQKEKRLIGYEVKKR
jgi:two-component system, sporulation sensor kinase E